MKARIRQILTDLERVRENLLTLSDDIWLSIDHNDADALQEGFEFKQAYNDKMASFNRLATDLSALIQQFTSVPVETPISADTSQNGAAENERIIHDLDREVPHSLDENFSYKRPYGFVLQGRAYKDIVTWQRVYKLTCLQLAQANRERFAALPTDPEFISRRGNKDFSYDQTELRTALEITNGIYAEVNLSANEIRKRITRLLVAFDIDPHSFVIYLREDRDASAAE